MVSYTEQENHADALTVFDMVAAIRNAPVPVVGKINGPALGGGAGMVAACDISFGCALFFWCAFSFKWTPVYLDLLRSSWDLFPPSSAPSFWKNLGIEMQAVTF